VRKLIVCNIVSLDGYYEGPGKDVYALPMDEAFDAYNAERLRHAGTLLTGRTSYEVFKGYWPPVDGDPDFKPVHWEISRRTGAIDKVVVSDSLTPEETEPWRHNTRIIRRADAHQQLAELKRQDGGDLLMFGSRLLWNDLLAHGLVDELHLMVGPVVLGGGTPAFDGTATPSLRLLEARALEGSENVLVRYEVRR
jgi:dihydrofolate reductase